MGFAFKSQRLQEIEELKTRFFDEPDHNAKAKIKCQIENELTACMTAAKRSLDYEITFDFNICFSEIFRVKGGFDVLIANPPYIGGKR
jgi:hypothetical protein